MLKIGDFAKLTMISINMLRNYDKIGLLTPKYIDELSGYRYYDVDQIVTANKIVALKNMGIGLDDIGRIINLPEKEIDDILRKNLVKRTKELENIKQQINLINNALNDESKKYTFNITKRTFMEVMVASFSGEIDYYWDEGVLWNKLFSLCSENGIIIAEDALIMATYLSKNDENGKILEEVQVCINKEYKFKPPLLFKKLPQRKVVSVVFKGKYSQICDINTQVAKWLEDNQLEIADNPFTIYYKSPGNCDNDNQFISEICFPIK